MGIAALIAPGEGEGSETCPEKQYRAEQSLKYGDSNKGDVRYGVLISDCRRSTYQVSVICKPPPTPPLYSHVVWYMSCLTEGRYRRSCPPLTAPLLLGIFCNTISVCPRSLCLCLLVFIRPAPIFHSLPARLLALATTLAALIGRRQSKCCDISRE